MQRIELGGLGMGEAVQMELSGEMLLDGSPLDIERMLTAELARAIAREEHAEIAEIMGSWGWIERMEQAWLADFARRGVALWPECKPVRKPVRKPVPGWRLWLRAARRRVADVRDVLWGRYDHVAYDEEDCEWGEE